MDIQNLVIKLKKSGMTQAAIGAEIRCSQSTISDIENGKIGKTRPAWEIVNGLLRLAHERGIETEQAMPTKRKSRSKTDKH